jgi:hypothetical protein
MEMREVRYGNFSQGEQEKIFSSHHGNFSIIPIKCLHKFFSRQTRENMGIENIWFLKQIARHEYGMT